LKHSGLPGDAALAARRAIRRPGDQLGSGRRRRSARERHSGRGLNNGCATSSEAIHPKHRKASTAIGQPDAACQAGAPTLIHGPLSTRVGGLILAAQQCRAAQERWAPSLAARRTTGALLPSRPWYTKLSWAARRRRPGPHGAYLVASSCRRMTTAPGVAPACCHSSQHTRRGGAEPWAIAMAALRRLPRPSAPAQTGTGHRDRRRM